MDGSNMQEQVLYIFQLVKQNKFDEAADALPSINIDAVLCSSEFPTSLISIEQTACRLFKDCLKYASEVDRYPLKYIEQMGLFNRRLATRSTENAEQIRIQSQVLFDKEVLQILVSTVDTLLTNDNFHRHDFIPFLCTWLEAIVHFVHRHDNLSTEVLQPLSQSMLSCVLSDWYRTYLKQSSDTNIPARLFFVRTCSFVTGVFQCSQLSFENALKTAQSYQIVIGIGEKIFDRNLVDFRQYLQQVKNIEDDSTCLTGICLLITNCYKYEVFRNDDGYFTLLLRLLRSDFVRKDLLPTWTNDSTILADTLMVQLKNSSNDSTIRLFLQQNQAANDIYPYMYAEYDRLRLQACMLLGVLLNDTMIRQLQIPSDKLTDLYFNAIQCAHKSANKCYRRVPIHLLLKALSALVHNDAIQISIATSTNYFDYLISITDDYNIVYDILWTLSFNNVAHEKFNSHEIFLTQLRTFVDQPQSAPEKDVARSAEGILWNLLDRNQVIALPDKSENVVPQNTTAENYCWAEQVVCKKIFERLMNRGYRVWFDQQNMHGNSLSAMAAAIENSQHIIICMSEHYEKSNACRHEAEFAYVRQRHIVPLVVQPKYKARDWLGFVIGASIYVDFNKHEFDRAFVMMEAELKATDKVVEQTIRESVAESDKKKIEPKKQDEINKDSAVELIEKKVEAKKQVSTTHENKPINEWTSDDVISWCQTHNLLTFVQLLEQYDGASLLRLHNMAKTNGDNDVFRLLQVDCQQLASNGQIKLTLTEFIRFQTELDKRLDKDSTRNKTMPKTNVKSGILCSLL